MLKNIKPSFRKICYNFIIGAFFCTSFVSVANADICFVLDQDCIDGGALNRMTQENEVCSGYDETYDISTSSNGLKCDSCNKGSMVKYKCYCKEDNLVRKGDRCVYKSDSVCPIADYYFDADRGAGWDCDACIDHKSEQYGKYKCDCDEDHLYKNNTCVEDACLFLKGKDTVSNSTASSRENQNWVCQKCTASSDKTRYYNKAHCECDGEPWGEYCIPDGRCAATQGYYNTNNIQCGTGDVVKRMNSGFYKGCYYCADDDSDVCPNSYTKKQEHACDGHSGWYVVETDVTSTKGYPCFTCRQYQCDEEQGYYYFESQCKKHYNIAWYENFDRIWTAVVNNLIPIKDAFAIVNQNTDRLQRFQVVDEVDGGGGGYVVAVGGGNGGSDCPCPKTGPGSGQYAGTDSRGRATYYDLSPCCQILTTVNDNLTKDIIDRDRVLDGLLYKEYRCLEDSTTKCWYGKVVDTDICPDGTDFYAQLTCPDSRYEKVDSGQKSAGSQTTCYKCQPKCDKTKNEYVNKDDCLTAAEKLAFWDNLEQKATRVAENMTLIKPAEAKRILPSLDLTLDEAMTCLYDSDILCYKPATCPDKVGTKINIDCKFGGVSGAITGTFTVTGSANASKYKLSISYKKNDTATVETKTFSPGDNVKITGMETTGKITGCTIKLYSGLEQLIMDTTDAKCSFSKTYKESDCKIQSTDTGGNTSSNEVTAKVWEVFVNKYKCSSTGAYMAVTNSETSYLIRTDKTNNSKTNVYINNSADFPKVLQFDKTKESYESQSAHALAGDTSDCNFALTTKEDCYDAGICTSSGNYNTSYIYQPGGTGSASIRTMVGITSSGEYVIIQRCGKCSNSGSGGSGGGGGGGSGGGGGNLSLADDVLNPIENEPGVIERPR